MTCEALRLLFDYYCKKPRRLCAVRLPRFFFKMPESCAIPIKYLRRKALRLDGLITPTFQARSVERWRKALGVFGFNGQREKILFPLTTI